MQSCNDQMLPKPASAAATISAHMVYGLSLIHIFYKALDDIARERKLTPEERQEQKKYAKLADSFTPLAFPQFKALFYGEDTASAIHDICTLGVSKIVFECLI